MNLKWKLMAEQIRGGLVVAFWLWIRRTKKKTPRFVWTAPAEFPACYYDIYNCV
jgi:hypothetical protein